MYYSGEMLWPQFAQLEWVRRLPLHEQVIQYNMYLENLSAQLQNTQINHAAGGTAPIPKQDSLPSNCIEFVVNTIESTYFEVEIDSSAAVNYTVNWGDGTIENDVIDTNLYVSHTYAEENQNYTVKICFDNPGLITQLNFPGFD